MISVQQGAIFIASLYFLKSPLTRNGRIRLRHFSNHPTAFLENEKGRKSCPIFRSVRTKWLRGTCGRPNGVGAHRAIFFIRSDRAGGPAAKALSRHRPSKTKTTHASELVVRKLWGLEKKGPRTLTTHCELNI